MKPKRSAKPFHEMTTNELADATEEFDREFVADTFGKAPPEARARHAKARKRGRPRKGAGARVISVSVEKDLLARSDNLAERMGISRASLIQRGLLAVLAAAGEDPRQP